jgi:hypothetical protein
MNRYQMQLKKSQTKQHEAYFAILKLVVAKKWQLSETYLQRPYGDTTHTGTTIIVVVV